MGNSESRIRNLFTMTIGLRLASRSFRTVFGAVLKGDWVITVRKHGREGGVVIVSEHVFRELAPGWEPDPSPPRRVRRGEMVAKDGPDDKI